MYPFLSSFEVNVGATQKIKEMYYLKIGRHADNLVRNCACNGHNADWDLPPSKGSDDANTTILPGWQYEAVIRGTKSNYKVILIVKKTYANFFSVASLRLAVFDLVL